MLTSKSQKKLNIKRVARKFFPVVVAVVVVGFGEGVHASTTFDDFNDNTLNSSLWVNQTFGSAVTVAETNQQLQISFANNAFNGHFNDPLGGGYRSANKINGDFDFIVNYQLSSWPSQNGVRLGLVVSTQGELLPVTSVLNWTAERISGGLNEPFGDVYLVDFGGNIAGITPSIDLAGSLRLQRTGSAINGYYLGSTGWDHIDGDSTFTLDPVYFGIAAWSHDSVFSDNDVKVAFDNVHVVPLPPSILLFGSGILSILLARKKAA